MPFYFGPGDNPTVSTKASEEKSIGSLFSSSRRVVQGETLADLSDQSFNSSIESGDSYLGDTIVEYPAILSLESELDAELLNATDAKSDNTRVEALATTASQSYGRQALRRLQKIAEGKESFLH
jgi:hypothetical protein